MKKFDSFLFSFLGAVIVFLCAFFLLTAFGVIKGENNKTSVANAIGVDSACEVGQISPNGTKVYVYDVLLVDFVDVSSFNKIGSGADFEKNFYYQQFCEVQQAYKNMSCGKVEIVYNFYLAHTTEDSNSVKNQYSDEYTYANEYAMFDKYAQTATVLISNQPECVYQRNKILFFENNGRVPNSTSWPHNVIANNDLQTCLICITCVASCNDDSQKKSFSKTLAHETMHTFGVKDAYLSQFDDLDLSRPVLYDISSCDYKKCDKVEISLSAYIREQLGWLEQSSIDDDKTTSIENVFESGTYTLFSTNTQNKTVALKFGENDGEAFYIELHFLTSEEIKIIINKSNDKYYSEGNLNATDAQSLFLLTELDFDAVNDANYSFTLSYANETGVDGTKIECSITNIKVFDNYVTFDFNINK